MKVFPYVTLIINGSECRSGQGILELDFMSKWTEIPIEADVKVSDVIIDVKIGDD